MSISKRKADHIRIVLEQETDFREKTNGLEKIDLVHCALPDLDFGDVSTETVFLNKPLSFPLLISSMTGGYADALEINAGLAEAAAEEGVALSVGSQRQILENDDFLKSYRIVRDKAPDGLIIGNLGAVEVARMDDFSPVRRMIDLIRADAMAIHLNPLQEILQPEGEGRFHGILEGVAKLVRHIDVPVIVKEVGCGISEEVARKLADVGVRYIDVAGAGGTSWAGVESYRLENTVMAERFWDWGIPTASSLEMVSRVKKVRIIASGGIRNGVETAKALALGAELCGAALPFLKALMEGGREALLSLLRSWREELKTAMFLTGCRDIDNLKRIPIIQKR